MNESQRTRHFWMWVILGPLAVALLIGALLYRQSPALTQERDQTSAPSGERDRAVSPTEGAR